MTMASVDLDRGLRAEADLSRIAGRLADVAAARFDVVAPQSALSCKGDRPAWSLDLGHPQITDHGVTESVIEARYTRTAWRQVADRLRIPLPYLDRLAGMENPIGPMLACPIDQRPGVAPMTGGPCTGSSTPTTGYYLRAVLSRPVSGDRQRHGVAGHHRRADRQRARTWVTARSPAT